MFKSSEIPWKFLLSMCFFAAMIGIGIANLTKPDFPPTHGRIMEGSNGSWRSLDATIPTFDKSRRSYIRVYFNELPAVSGDYDGILVEGIVDIDVEALMDEDFEKVSDRVTNAVAEFTAGMAFRRGLQGFTYRDYATFPTGMPAHKVIVRNSNMVLDRLSSLGPFDYVVGLSVFEVRNRPLAEGESMSDFLFTFEEPKKKKSRFTF